MDTMSMGLSNVPGVVRRTGQECFGSWRTSAPSCSCIAFKNKQPPLCLQSTVLPDSKQIPRRRSSRRMSSIYTQARLKNDELQVVTEKAARAGAALVREAVDKPRNIKFKGATDLVTETDTSSEAAILQIIQDAFPNHAILGEEGGVSGDVTSEYLWCVDPLDGTTNFAHGYPSFAVSVACLHRAIPVAATVIEFAGGPGTWVQREYSAKRNGGATLNGESIRVSNTHELQNSLVVTGFGYEHDAPWLANMKLFQEFTDITRGVRRLGSAAIDMCHVACGITDAYWEYRLKPWDMAAGVLIAEEAGATVTTMDARAFSVFDRSVLVSNGYLHEAILAKTEPATTKLVENGVDLSQWFIPQGYSVHSGAQLE